MSDTQETQELYVAVQLRDEIERLEAENKGYEVFLETLRDCANEKNKIIDKQAKVIETIKIKAESAYEVNNPNPLKGLSLEILSIINGEGE